MRLSLGLQYTTIPVSYAKKKKKKKKKWTMQVYQVFRGSLKDLCNTFDCISHNVFIAKLEVYCFQIDILNLVYDYLSKRKQRANINEAFHFWKDIEYSVQQRSIVGLLLFNIHLCDLFYFFEDLDITSYADYTTICTVKGNKKSVIYLLEASS